MACGWPGQRRRQAGGSPTPRGGSRPHVCGQLWRARAAGAWLGAAVGAPARQGRPSASRESQQPGPASPHRRPAPALPPQAWLLSYQQQACCRRWRKTGGQSTEAAPSPFRSWPVATWPLKIDSRPGRSSAAEHLPGPGEALGLSLH